MIVCGLPLHLGILESCKALEQKFIFQIGTLNPPRYQHMPLIQPTYSCFSRYYVHLA